MIITATNVPNFINKDLNIIGDLNIKGNLEVETGSSVVNVGFITLGDTSLGNDISDLVTISGNTISTGSYTGTNFSGTNVWAKTLMQSDTIIGDTVISGTVISGGNTRLNTGSSINGGLYLNSIGSGNGIVVNQINDYPAVLIKPNNRWMSSTANGGASSVNMFKINTSDEIDVGATLNAGEIELVEDSGVVTLVNLPVSDTPVADTEESYCLSIDSNPIFTIYAEADGSGGIQNERVFSTIMGLNETTTPTAIADKGAVYTKSTNRLFFQDGAGNEHTLAQTDSNYAEMYFNNNAVATVIETADTPIMLRNTTTGTLNNWTYHSGSTGEITAYSDGTGKVNVASSTHGLISGDIISIRGTTNYNGLWTITLIDANNFSIPDTWAADDGASDWDQGDYLLAGTGAAGIYSFDYSISCTVLAADTLLGQISKDGVICSKCISQRKFVDGDIGNLIGTAIITIAEDERISLILQSDSTTNVTIKYGDFNIHRL